MMCIYLQIRKQGKNPRPVCTYYNNEKLKLFLHRAHHSTFILLQSWRI